MSCFTDALKMFNFSVLVQSGVDVGKGNNKITVAGGEGTIIKAGNGNNTISALNKFK